MLKQILSTLFLLVLTHSTTAQEFGDEAYAVLMSTFMYDESYPLNPRIAGVAESDGISYQRVVLDSFHGGAVPGILSAPQKGSKPFPVVMLLHGLNHDKESWLKDESTHGSQITRGLLAKGYAVMALDAQYHGDRAVYNDYIDPGEMVFRRGWVIRYKDLVTQTIIDYRRAIDYLGTRDEFDLNRVGIVGYSMGGHMTFLLAASDPRIKAVVACVIPETAGLLIEASTFVRSLEKTPLLMMMARKDQFYTVESAQKMFDSIPGKNKDLRFFESGHSLPPEYAPQVVDWLAETL